MKKVVIVSLFLNLALLVFIACGGGGGTPSNGGGGGNPPVTPKSIRAAMGVIPGAHVFASTQSTSYKFSLVPTVHAQTTTSLKLSQSWNGICTQSPYPTFQVGQTASYPIYGLGQMDNIKCNNTWSFDTDGSGAAANAQYGQLVVGDGTISNLVAWTSQGTSLPNGNSGHVHVYIKRNGTVIDTGVKCTLGQGTGLVKCNSTATFAALDGDLVIGTITWQPDDVVVGLNVMFTKQ